MLLKMVGIQEEDRKLKITMYTHLNALQSLLYLALILAILLYIFNFDEGMLIAFTIGLGIDAVTSMYLHLTYFFKNKGEEYEISDTGLIRRKEGKETIYKSNEIEKVIVFLSPALYKNSNFHLLAIEGYHYAIVKLKTGEELMLTCLLSARIDKSLKKIKGVYFERKKKLFCSI